MSRFAQCPSCHTGYELDDDDLGAVLQCECGASLFACDASDFDEIPVTCSGCGEAYEVGKEELGEVLECECGQSVRVPDVIFRLPMTTTAAAELNSVVESASTELIVACPKCGSEYGVSADDVDTEAQCECGVRFRVIRNDKDQLIAVPANPPVAAAIVTQPEQQTRRSAPRETEDGERKKPRNWLGIIGVGSVALFLLVSIVMFLTRDLRSADPIANVEAKKQVVSVTADPPAPQLSADAAPGAAQSTPNTSAAQPAASVPTSRSQSGIQVSITETTGALKSADRNSAGKSKPTAPRPKKTLPKRTAPRPLVPIVSADRRGLTFDKMYELALVAYDAAMASKLAADASGDAADIEKYHKELGTAIGLMQQAHEMATLQDDASVVNELRYLLAYLNYFGGHVVEASIYGEAVARWGDLENDSTHEAAMIAMAATQEANSAQWGLAENVAELRQMQTLAEVIQARWPDDEQLDVIWMNLGQLYESFHETDAAVAAYARIKEGSEHYINGQLAAGRALWSRCLDELQANPSAAETLKPAMQRAKKFLTTGAESLEQDASAPMKTLFSARLTLARMELRTGNPQQAEKWLTREPLPVIDSMVLTEDEVTAEKGQVSKDFMRLAYETLFAARSELNDPVGAQEALRTLAARLGSDGGGEMAKLFLSVVTEYIDRLSNQATVTADQVAMLQELATPLAENESAMEPSNVLWLGESWSKLGDLAATPAVAQQCFAAAADAYQRAMDRADFPAGSLQAARLRRVQFLRSAGRSADAYEMIAQVLAETPNAFGLQMEAAYALQDIGISSNDPVQLEAAISGPNDAPAIWGWAKLVTTIHTVRFSEGGTDRHAQQLLECQYNLVKCRWLLSSAVTDAARAEELRGEVKRLLATLLTTISHDQQPWYDRLQKLKEEVGN